MNQNSWWLALLLILIVLSPGAPPFVACLGAAAKTSVDDCLTNRYTRLNQRLNSIYLRAEKREQRWEAEALKRLQRACNRLAGSNIQLPGPSL